jgi:hypothetical protein
MIENQVGAGMGNTFHDAGFQPGWSNITLGGLDEAERLEKSGGMGETAWWQQTIASVTDLFKTRYGQPQLEPGTYRTVMIDPRTGQRVETVSRQTPGYPVQTGFNLETTGGIWTGVIIAGAAGLLVLVMMMGRGR